MSAIATSKTLLPITSSKDTPSNQSIPIDLNTMKSLRLNLRNLLSFEEYFELLIKSLHGQKLTITSTSIDLWKFYFKSRLYKTIEFYLIKTNPELLQSINKYFKMLLIIVLITYDASFTPSFLKSILSLINRSLIKLHRVLLILMDYFVEHQSLSINSGTKKDLTAVINAKLRMKPKSRHIEEIASMLTETAYDINRLIFKYDSISVGSEIQLFWSNISTISNEDINVFFQSDIKRKTTTLNYKDEAIVIEIGNNKSNTLPLITNTTFNTTTDSSQEDNQIENSNSNSSNNSNSKDYTIVLDLDETLIHFKFEKGNEGTVQFRPHLFQFLDDISKHYEIVVFTAGMKEYADTILNLIEKRIGKKVFDNRLYRHHTSVTNGAYLKDLNIIGRDLNKVLIVDNLSDNFQCQKSNGIEIYPYYGNDLNDKCLLYLKDILLNIADNKPDDIRTLKEFYAKEIKDKVSLK